VVVLALGGMVGGLWSLRVSLIWTQHMIAYCIGGRSFGSDKYRRKRREERGKRIYIYIYRLLLGDLLYTHMCLVITHRHYPLHDSELYQEFLDTDRIYATGRPPMDTVLYMH
jgi:hypothetical protein